MTTLASLEAINLEQLATATDRVLLLGGSRAARPSRPSLDLTNADERTVHVRSAPPWRTFTVSSLVVALVAVSASIASLL